MNPSLNVIFAGTPEFAAVALRALLSSSHRISAVYTQPDRPAGRGRKLSASPVKELALAHGIAVYQPSTLKTPESQRELAALQVDVMVVVAYGLILPKAVLAAPRLGCLNIHASLLPRWRGAAPIQRAILAGDARSGVCIMQMDEGLDTGPVLAVRECAIEPNDTSATVHDRLASLGARAIVETLGQLTQGEMVATPQDSTHACYAHKIEKAEAQLDWSRSALELDRVVRAFNPWPVAFTYWRGAVLRVWSTQALSDVARAAPGTVVAVTKQGIDVATGAGVLRLLTVQAPGGKALPVADYLNSQRDIAPGVLFGVTT